jgi:hypothetical protein
LSYIAAAATVNVLMSAAGATLIELEGRRVEKLISLIYRPSERSAMKISFDY